MWPHSRAGWPPAKIGRSVPRSDHQVNVDAFRAGRKLVLHPQGFDVPRKNYSYESMLEEKTRFLGGLYGRSTAQAYRELVGEAVFHGLELRIIDTAGFEDAAPGSISSRMTEKRGQFRFRVVDIGLIARGDPDLGPLVQEKPRAGKANALGAARDQHALALKF